jgi:lipid II:glycine glycyltransferase (peptidoglycan interpeptide bridge formation enzyme)
MIRPAQRDVSTRIRKVGAYTVRVSREADDQAWDDFLESSPIGHHAQTSCWGRARASIGWRPVRVVISEDGRVVGGAQMVTRPMPIGGEVGFVHRGPNVPEDRPDLVALVFDEMMAMGKRNDVQYLVVQPPPGAHWMVEELARRGFRYGAFDIDHTATLRADLRLSLDQLLANMGRNRRKHLRSAHRRGLTIRRGSEADLPIFSHLKDLHSARLGYARRSPEYYEEVWRALSPRGHIELFVAEFEGEPVSAQLLIPFGDTCRHMERPWSGAHGNRRPNEIIEWEAVQWAKSAGYLFTDWEGIEAPVAAAMLSGAELPRDPAYSAARFKVKFGGDVVVDPSSYDYVYNPVLRFGYRCIPVKVMRSAWVRRVLFRFRETGS